jgi:hypothetical protein
MLTTGDKPRVRLVGAEQLAQWDKAAQGCAGITGFRPISPMLLGDKRLTLNDLRSAAEMMRCERLMVVAEGESEADNFNHAAALYWTFVGLWLVPGNVVEHRAVTRLKQPSNSCKYCVKAGLIPRMAPASILGLLPGIGFPKGAIGRPPRFS